MQGMLEMGRAQGMQSMDTSIVQLVSSGSITVETACANAQDPEKMRKVLAA